MAVKQTTCKGTWGSKYILYMEYNLVSQNIANNTSRIRLRMYAQSTSSQYRAYNLNPSANSYRIKVDGSVKTSGNKAMDFRNRQIVELGTWEGNITHNSDGTKTVTIEGSFSISGTSSLSGGDISFTWRLPTIPRASDVSAPSSANFGTAITINHTRKSSSFTITLRYRLGNASGTIANKVARNSTSWTIPNNLMNQIPNATSGTLTIYCDTYSGSTKIGTKSTTIKVNVPSSVVPTFNTITHSEQNSVVAALNLGKYIQGLSRIRLTITGASGTYGSTIKSYKIEFEGKAYTSSSTTVVPAKTGSLTAKATITDSRGRTASKSVTINVLAYAPPKLNSYSAKRIDGTNIRVSYGMTVKRLEGKNTCTVTIKTKERGQTYWTTVRTIDIDLTNEEITGTSTLQDYDITKSFDIRIEVKDKFNTTVAETSVSTDFVVMSLSSTGVGIGKIHEQGTLDVRGDVYIDGSIYVEDRRVVYKSYSDANEITEEWALGRNGSNYPGDSFWYINTIAYSSSVRKQIAYGYRNGEIYTRYCYGNEWSDWVRVATDGHMITLSLQNGWSGTLNAHKFSNRLVGLTANIKAGTISSETIIATIPAGYRPYRIMPVLAFNVPRGRYCAGLYIRSYDGAIVYINQPVLNEIAEGEEIHFNIMYVGGN